MERGFIFMLDAFISLLIVVAFVSTLNQLSRDYSYIQDETLYSYGRSIMNILLYRTITVNGQEIAMVHTLSNNSEWKKIDELIPKQIGYSVEYYNGTEWKSFGDAYNRPKPGAKRAISVVSTIPVIIQDEKIEYPYKYDDYCPGPSFQAGANVCMVPTDLYTPVEFATGNASYGTTFIRVIVKV